jgi:CheY-like chemotaxis protein
MYLKYAHEIQGKPTDVLGGLDMARKKILVVDDDPELRLALELRLKANGYAVALASDGTTGVTQTQLHRPDLILLDLGLPAGDGFSVMESLKKDTSTSSIPVIVITGRDRASNLDRALKEGVYTFLQKPVQNVRLLALIGQALAPWHPYG